MSERLEGGKPLPAHLHGAVIALGNFDGFHLGHQAVVRRATELARELGVAAIVATFDPHPVRHFAPHAPPFRLTSLDQRQTLLANAGADAMLVFDFGEPLARVTPREFVHDWLADAGGVVTGSGFSFGRERSGDVRVLAELCDARGLICDAVSPVLLDRERVSSSLARHALRAGDCLSATRLLTRPFAIDGVVEAGDGVSTAGEAVAIVNTGDYLLPRKGLYAVRATRADGSVGEGMARVGGRPGQPNPSIELGVFDQDAPLANQPVQIEFIARLAPRSDVGGRAGAACERVLEDVRRALASDLGAPRHTRAAVTPNAATPPREPRRPCRD